LGRRDAIGESAPILWPAGAVGLTEEEFFEIKRASAKEAPGGKIYI